MYWAILGPSAHFQTLPSPAFNFGTGDFTVMAMMSSEQGGTLVARKGAPGGSGNGGFLLVVNPNGSVKFATDDGTSFYQVVTGPTGILNGDCHAIAGVRANGVLSIYIDGVSIPTTASGTGRTPLNVDNSLPVTFGCTQQTQEPHNQFTGALMNVSLWDVALSDDLFVSATFNRIAPTTPGLQGYWTLDATTDDLSPNDNPANIIGRVTYDYCFHCAWAQSDNAYLFYHVANKPGPNAPSETVTVARDIVIPAGAPAFGLSLMADQDAPAFPIGAQIVLTDPSGTTHNQEQNSPNVFAHLSGSQLWTFMAINPASGTWRVTVTAPATTAFHLNVQTVPSADVVDTCRRALQPLYPDDHPHVQMLAGAALGGFWSTLGKIAVGVVVGVAVTGAIIFSGGAATPAVLAGIVAFAGVEYGMAASALPDINTGSLPTASHQIGGMSGFIVAADRLLVFDANVDADVATQLIYKQRLKKLYPQIALSPYNKVQTLLVGDQVRRIQIATALTSFASGYVTGSGHGRPSYLTGWYTNGAGSPLEEIISVNGSARFAPAEVAGKIFHFFACNCGYTSPTSQGLGQAMVAAGAIAFFGYNIEFVIAVNETPAFCAGDIAIDLALIAGKTCDQAYVDALAIFDANIARLKANGDMRNAALLQRNRDALVSPTVNAIFGRKDARLNP